MLDITALEAVNPEKNDIYCASVERFGYHEFATLKEHNVNAKNIRLDYCPRRKKNNFEV
jgi:UPF0755 protein